MLFTTLAAVAAFGLILGSFLNALLYRYNTGRSALRGRSVCMHCGHTLSALDLVPLLSYIFLRGRCRYCGSRISPQYPLVELSAGVLAVALYMRNPEPFAFALAMMLWLTLLFIFVYDLRHYIIPWEAAVVLAVTALVGVHLSGPTVLTIAAGPLLALPLFFISFISKGEWMGWGDGMLELGIGWALGLTAGLTAFCISFWLGALVGIALIGLSKRYTMKSEVPFAPFLIAGAACAYFLHVDLFQTLPALFF